MVGKANNVDKFVKNNLLLNYRLNEHGEAVWSCRNSIELSSDFLIHHTQHNPTTAQLVYGVRRHTQL